MIVDHLHYADLYRPLHPRFAAGLDFLRSFDPKTFSPGRTSLDGDALFAIQQEYVTRPRNEGKWEAHRKYADIQFIVDGVEEIGWAGLETLQVTEPYSPERDVTFLQGDGAFLKMQAGYFAIFYPQDAHLPGVALEAPASVRKVVVKILLDD